MADLGRLALYQKRVDLIAIKSAHAERLQFVEFLLKLIRGQADVAQYLASQWTRQIARMIGNGGCSASGMAIENVAALAPPGRKAEADP